MNLQTNKRNAGDKNHFKKASGKKVKKQNLNNKTDKNVSHKNNLCKVICSCKRPSMYAQKKPRKKRYVKSLKPCDNARPYLHNFVSDVWSYLTPDIIDTLKDMLVKEFGMKPREAEIFVLDQRLRSAFRNESDQKQKLQLPCFPFPPESTAPPPPFPCPIKFPPLLSDTPPEGANNQLSCPPFPCPLPCPPFPCLPICPPSSSSPCPPTFPCLPLCPPKQQHTKTDQPKNTPSQNDSPKKHPQKQDPSNTGQSKQEPSKQDPAKQDPPTCPPPCPPFPCSLICPPCIPPPPYPCCTSPDKSISGDDFSLKKKKKKTKKSIGLRYYWAKEMNEILSIKLNDYIAMMLSKRRTKRVKCISEVILKNMCDFTGEKFTFSTANTRAKKIMVFVADRIAMWLADISCTCDNALREDCIKKATQKKDDNEGKDDDKDENKKKKGNKDGKDDKYESNKKKGQRKEKNKEESKSPPESSSSEKKSNSSAGEEKEKNKTEEEEEDEEIQKEKEEDKGKEKHNLGKKAPSKALSKKVPLHSNFAVKFSSKPNIKNYPVSSNVRQLSKSPYLSKSKHFAKKKVESKIMSEEKLEQETKLKEEKKVNKILEGVLVEIKSKSSDPINMRAKEIATVLNENFHRRIVNLNENANEETARVVSKVSKKIGIWLDDVVADAEKEFMRNLPPAAKLDLSNKEDFYDEAFVIKQMCSELLSESITENKAPYQHYETVLNDIILTKMEKRSGIDYLSNQQVENHSQEKVQKNKLFKTEEIEKWKNDTIKHAMKWKQNQLLLNEAAQIWKTKIKEKTISKIKPIR